MGIPKQDRLEITRDDLRYRENEPDTLALQFFEPTPANKLLFKIRPEELGVIRSIGYSFSCTDNSVNGYIQIIISRIPNPFVNTTINSQNQIVWSKRTGVYASDGKEDFPDDSLYLQRGEELYVYLFSNIPAGAGLKVLGEITLYLRPTYR